MTTRPTIDPDLNSLINEMTRFLDKPESFQPDELEVMMVRARNAVCRLALLKEELTESMAAIEAADANSHGRA